MKKGKMQWGGDEEEDSSEEPSSTPSASDSNADNTEFGKRRKSKKTILRIAKKDKKAFDYMNLCNITVSKAVGLPVIPSPEEKPNWSMATRKDKQRAEEVKESYQEREATRAAVVK